MPDALSVVNQSKSSGFMVMVNAPIAKPTHFLVVMAMNVLSQSQKIMIKPTVKIRSVNRLFSFASK